MKRLIIVFLFIAGIALLSWVMMDRGSLEVIEDLARPETSLITGQSENFENVPNQKSTVDTINKPTDNQNQYDMYFKSLPIMDDLKNLSEEEVHHTPEIIKDGGEVIGRIHEEAENDPSKRIEAMSFFKKCVEDQQIVTVIRAVCLNKIYRLVPEWQIPAPLEEAEISDEVLKLSLRLP
jgi:hypothetical protein